MKCDEFEVHFLIGLTAIILSLVLSRGHDSIASGPQWRRGQGYVGQTGTGIAARGDAAT